MLSSNFVNKVLDRVDKLDSKNLKEFIKHLAQDRELFSSILGSMIEGVLVLDDKQKIKYINKTANIMLQLPDNALEQNFFKVLPEHYPLDYIKKLLKDNKKIQDKKLNVKYPASKIIKLSIYPFVQTNSTIIGSVLVFLDISLQTEEKQKLRRAESLASLTTLSAGVAHEIKNPLTSLDIYVQLADRLVDNIDHSVKHQLKEYLGVISEEIVRLNQIVTDFLFTVKPATTKLNHIDIFALINSSYTLLKPNFEKKGVSFSIYAKKDIPKIQGNENYLTRAFVNIFKNSIEANSTSISVSIHEKNKEINIEIKDNGKGIPQENINKIFEPYFTTQDFGSGLGLTIVYKIIKEHNGHITLDSEQNIGTKFTIVLLDKEKDKLLLDYNEKTKQQ